MEERLQKYMARCGVASRRKCEELIILGKVMVNDILITELGSKINCEKDIVKYNGQIIKPEEKMIYILLNKPEGYITSAKDEKNRKTVLDIVGVSERIYPIGRLDYDSSGAIILTNDGNIYNKIIHPRKNIIKKYLVEVKGIIKIDEIKRLKNGVDIGGYITKEAEIKVIEQSRNTTVLEVGIFEGKNRQIRKMCEAVNHEVITLKRISIGEIKINDLKIGEYRELTAEELDYINKL